MDEPLRICLLGGYSLAAAGQPIMSLNADRPQTLLAYLLLHQQAPVSRQHLAFTLWPDSTDVQARTNLRNLLHTLRRALPDADAFLALDTHTIQWRPLAPFWLDVAAFESALAAAEQAADEQAQRQWLETAVAHYKGPLLPGNYDDWIIPRREGLHQAYLDALHQAAFLQEQAGDYQAAIHSARQWQQQDPLSETAVILLMRLHAHGGDQAGVHRAYQACVAAFRQELDAEPGPETQAAYAAAQQRAVAGRELQDTGEGTAVAAVVRASPRRAGQLPPQPTPFVGRQTELAHLAQLLADPRCRLVTVVGPGGVGKTSLALQAANGHVPVFRHGAAFVPLAAITDPMLIPFAITQSLHIPLNTIQPRHAQLLHYVQDKELLLLLDNVEQLSHDVTFLREVLAAGPQVKLLVTSRQRLNLQEEWVFDLQGLPLPDDHPLEQVEENSAAALFWQAARRHDTAFKPGEPDRAAIVRICRLVDGMPLALELAAAWVRLLSCTEIGDEIEKNLDFLTTSQQNVPDRHRSIRAVFDQSWQLLTQPEQAVFSHLSLFRGGFDREAAEQVAKATLPLLAALLDKSLIRRLDNGRYDVHELVRQYAAARLAADPKRQAAAQARLAAYYLALAEMGSLHLTGADQQTWLERLEREYDNLRTVLAWALATPEVETAVRLGAALGRFWWLRYRPVEGGNWLHHILALPGPVTEVRARAMSYAGLLARLRRDYATAEACLTQSISWQRGLDHKQDLGRSLNEMGMLLMDRGEFALAGALFGEWLLLARELDFPHGISIALLNSGMAAYYQGDYAVAEDFYKESLNISRQMGLKTNTAMVLNSYGMLLLAQQRTVPAQAMLVESVQLNSELGYKDGLAWAFLGLVTMMVQAERLELAACLVGVVESLRQALGSPLPPANQAYFDEIVADLHHRLGAEAFARQQQLGRGMSWREAAALVMEG